MTAGHLEKVASGIQKNPVTYFATSVHKKYEYASATQSIKNSLIDIYHRFLSQSFESLDVGASVFKK